MAFISEIGFIIVIVPFEFASLALSHDLAIFIFIIDFLLNLDPTIVLSGHDPVQTI